MSDCKSSLEVHFEVWDDKEGVCIRVGPDRDGGSYVEISTKDDKSIDYFGKLALVLPPVIARNLGKALLKCCEEIEIAELKGA